MEYVYGRLRGRRAKLLGDDVFETLLREDLHSFENVLKDTRYGGYVSELRGALSGVELYVKAYDRAFADEMRKVESLLEGKEKLSFDVYLGRWDLHNFITIVRGRFYGVPDGEIRMALLPAGVLDEVRLRELLKEEDALSVVMRAKVAFKGLPFVIRREAILSLRNGDLAGFEYNVYRSFFERVFSLNVHPIVHLFFNYLIDSKNVSISYISLKGGERPSYWLPGGNISPRIRHEVLGVEEMEEFENLMRRYIGLEGPFSLEKVDSLFEGRFFKRVRKNALSDPVSFFFVMEYAWRVEREVVDLRTITYAKSFGIEASKIREVIHV